MAYTPKQKRVAYHYYDVGRRKGATDKEQLSALEMALTEANLGNPKGGDADSIGSRQERAHYGSAAKRLNVRGAAGRYFDETKAAGRGKGKSAGQLAQAVQRSAYPGRYDEREKQAADLLKWLKKTYGDKPGGGKGGGGRPQYRTGLKTEKTPAVDNSALRAQAKMGYLSQRGKPGALLDLASQLQDARDVPAETRVTGTKREKIPGSGSKGKAAKKGKGGGKVIIAAGADRAGAPTRSYLKRELKRFSAAAGTPIEVTTGTNHNQMTASGNVSDHWTGRGADIGLKGDARQDPGVRKKGDLIAGRTLMSLGISRKKARQMAQKGGLHNVNYKGKRYQVIWKTNEGGNHYNHVHIGIR